MTAVLGSAKRPAAERSDRDQVEPGASWRPRHRLRWSAPQRGLGGLLVVALTAMALTAGLALLRATVVDYYRVPSGSMRPTLQVGDRVVVDRLAYRHGRRPGRGDVVVFTLDRPSGRHTVTGARGGAAQGLEGANAEVTGGQGSSAGGDQVRQTLVKRVVGLPGDTIDAVGGKLDINGRVSDEPYLAGNVVTRMAGPVIVPAGYLWVMGDNRSGSADSRVFGAIPETAVIGRVTHTWHTFSG